MTIYGDSHAQKGSPSIERFVMAAKLYKPCVEAVGRALQRGSMLVITGIVRQQGGDCVALHKRRCNIVHEFRYGSCTAMDMRLGSTKCISPARIRHVQCISERRLVRNAAKQTVFANPINFN